MRVAVHVGQLLQPVPGGIGRYVEHLVRSLPGAGVEPVTFAAGPRPRRLTVGEGCADIPYVDLGWPTGALRYEAWHRWRRPAVPVPADVVHAPSLAVAPPGRRPLVVTVHDLVFLHHPEHLTARGVSFHRRGLELARREAAAVVVPTAYGRDELVAEGFGADRVHVAPHGVDVAASPSGPEGASRLRPDVRQPFVLFVGTLEPRKGVAALLAAHQALRRSHPDLGLVLAGGHGWGTALDLSGPGVVAFGHAHDDELDALYRAAVALALPSRYEGFGLPVIEAMARGCPVVTSDAGALAEVAGGAGTVVPGGDADSLAGALERLIDDDGHRADRVGAGYERAAPFTWAASARAHAGAYRAALGGPG